MKSDPSKADPILRRLLDMETLCTGEKTITAAIWVVPIFNNKFGGFA